MNKSDFTHWARFYGVPCYFNEHTGELAGRNRLFDRLLIAATWFHNTFIEFGAQVLAALTGAEYEPGFPIYVWGFEENER